jgi:hypothetical protein
MPNAPVVDIAPGAATIDSHRVGCRVYSRAAQATEIDHECVIPDTQTASVVPCSADGERDVVLPREVDADDDIGDVGAANECGRSPVDRSVVDGPGLVVAGVRGECESAPYASHQLVKL